MNQFYQDLKLEYSINLTQNFEDTSKYEVIEVSNHRPLKQTWLSKDEMLKYFSKIVVYLLDNGYTISFRNSYHAVIDSFEIIAVLGDKKQSHIISNDIFALANCSIEPITEDNYFNNYYIDMTLVTMSITRIHYEILANMLKGMYLR